MSAPRGRLLVEIKADYAARIAWGKPESERSDFCSLCFARIPDNSVPLMVFKQDGHAAQFCDPCVSKAFTVAR